MALNFERVRDFLLLHYVATQRDDSEMWRYFRNMTLPDSLQEKLDAWMRRGYVLRYEFGVFLPPSWVAVMLGQNLMPNAYDPRADRLPLDALQAERASSKSTTVDAVASSPDQSAFLERYGAATNVAPLTAS